MITLKIGKAICPVCQKLKQSVSLLSDKLKTLALFFVENKDWTKAEIVVFFFKEKITLKHSKL